LVSSVWFPLCWCCLDAGAGAGAGAASWCCLGAAAWVLLLALLVGGGDEVCEGLETGWIRFNFESKGIMMINENE